MDLSEIKKNRLREPEMFLLDIFDGIVEYVSVDDPDIVYYTKNEREYFKYNLKLKIIIYSSSLIYNVFLNKFNLNYRDINDLVQYMVQEHLNLRVETTIHL